ncbi:MAG: hypothetical protein U9Q82_14835 [Chloroflexota bacterium]|nr:hypothetical protein [Chloroflexota bacterium]
MENGVLTVNRCDRSPDRVVYLVAVTGLMTESPAMTGIISCDRSSRSMPSLCVPKGIGVPDRVVYLVAVTGLLTESPTHGQALREYASRRLA